MSDIPLPTYDDVVAAASRIEPLARRTPVHTSRTLDEWLGGASLLEVRELPARRGLQVSRSGERDLTAHRSGAQARRPHLLVRQPRPGHLAGRAPAGGGGDGGDAPGRSGGEAPSHGRLRRARGQLRSRHRGPAGSREAPRRGNEPRGDPALRPPRRHRRAGHGGEGADRGGGTARPAARVLRRGRPALGVGPGGARPVSARRRSSASSPRPPTTPPAPSRPACCRR